MLVRENKSLIALLCLHQCCAAFPKSETNDGKSWKVPTFPEAGYSGFPNDKDPFDNKHTPFGVRVDEPLRGQVKMVRITSPESLGYEDTSINTNRYVHGYAKVEHFIAV